MVETTVPPLASIYYNPVGTCNLRCRHCWIDPDVDGPSPQRSGYDGAGVGNRDTFEQRDRRGDELSPAQFFAILDDAKKLGLNHVKFTGGEPFLRRDTIDMMEGAVAKELGLTVETNATLLDDETIARLAKLKPSQVAVSVDSVDPAYHDRFRGAKGAHARATDRTGKLVAAGCKVQIIMAVTRENVDGCEALIEFAKQLGVWSVKLCPVLPIGRGGRECSGGVQLSPREIIGLRTQFARCSESGPRVLVEVPPAFLPIRDIRSLSRCRIRNLLGLLPDGGVSYCGVGMSNEELVMGNLLHDGLAELWETHPLLQLIRSGLPNGLEGVCSRCIMKAMCLGVCRVHAYMIDGSLLAPHRLCEEAEEQGFFPASRMIAEPVGCDKARAESGP